MKTYIKYQTSGLEKLYESIAVLQVLPFVFYLLDADKGLSYCFRWGLYILTQVCCASLQVVNVFLFWIILENKIAVFILWNRTSPQVCTSVHHSSSLKNRLWIPFFSICIAELLMCQTFHNFWILTFKKKKVLKETL